MSSFWKRLRFYGVGFGIGLAFVLVFLPNRGCEWYPSNRVKNMILDRVLVLTEQNEQILKDKNLKSQHVVQLLNDGDVIFSKSRREGNLKTYFIENDSLSAFFTLPEESFISEVILKKGKVASIQNETKGMGRLIHFPNEKDIIFVDTSGKLSCELKSLGMQKQQLIFKELKKTGRIDFSKSNFNATPKVEHYLTYEGKEGLKIGMKAVWYKNKININQFDLPFETDCK